MKAIFDALRGEALIGSLRIPIVDAGNGALRAGPGGAVLRPVSFGERTRIVTRAAFTDKPLDGIAAGILATATAQPGSGDPTMLEIVALALAGGDEPGPSFAETVQRLALATGWQLAEIAEASAAEIDGLVSAIAPAAPDGGWTRVQFGEASGADDEAAAVRREYAENLLRRVDGASPRPAAPDVAVPSQMEDATGDEGMRTSLPEATADDTARLQNTPPVAPADAASDDSRAGDDGATPVAPPRRGEPAFRFRARLLPRDGALERRESISASQRAGSARPAAIPSDATSGAVPDAGVVPGSEAAVATEPPSRDSVRVAPDAPAWTDVSGVDRAAVNRRGDAQRSSETRSGWRTEGAPLPERRTGFALLDEPAPAARAFPLADAEAVLMRWPVRPEGFEPPSEMEADELADRLAALLEEESDLRGLDR
jgi:hypothetical protein